MAAPPSSSCCPALLLPLCSRCRSLAVHCPFPAPPALPPPPQAGVWRDGRLDSEMEEWQCALAVEGASEAAVAARRVPVGGGTAADTLQALLADPATWAYLCAGALVLAGRSLTPTLDLLTSQLAVAHGPLALLALGLTLDIDPPTPRQVG